jgi:transposase
MSSTRTQGEKTMPHRDPTDSPRRRAHKRKGHGTYGNDRPPIISIISRDTGEQRWWVCDHADPQTCHNLIADNVPSESTLLYTDEWQSYRGSHPDHATVAHGVREWARDDNGDGQREVHCNTCEGAVASSSHGRRRWDAPAFFADAETRLTPGQLGAVHRLHDWAAEHADEVRYGTGTQRGSFSAGFTHIHGRSVFTIYSDGTLTLNFKWLTTSPDAEAWAERLAAELGRAQWLPIPADFKDRFVSFGAAEWTPRVGELIDVLARLAT